MRGFTFVMGACLALALDAVALAATDTPEQVVRSTADAVIAKVTADRDALRADPKRLNALVDEMIVPRFDFPRMAQWVLGKYWRDADAAARGRFIEEFKNLLVRTYATALLEYSNQNITYFPVQATSDSRSVTVKTEIEQPGSVAVPILYRMHVKDGYWKVYDIAVDGVSLITTYRASFASEIRKSGIDGLIDNLAARNSSTSAAATQTQ